MTPKQPTAQEVDAEIIFKYRGFHVYLTESLSEDETVAMRQYLDCLRDNKGSSIDDKLIEIVDKREIKSEYTHG